MCFVCLSSTFYLLRCSWRRKFLIKMNSFATAYTMWIDGVVVAVIFSPYLKICCSTFVISVFVSRIFIKIKHITTSNFFGNQKHVCSLPVRISLSFSMSVFVRMWRKLIRDNSQMEQRLHNVHGTKVFWSIEANILMPFTSNLSVGRLVGWMGKICALVFAIVNNKRKCTNILEIFVRYPNGNARFMSIYLGLCIVMPLVSHSKYICYVSPFLHGERKRQTQQKQPNGNGDDRICVSLQIKLTCS